MCGVFLRLDMVKENMMVLCVKRAFSREKLKFEEKAKFKNAHEIVEWCNKYLCTRSSENSTVKCFFYLVEEKNILSRYDSDTISGSTKWH